jgi:hypothetical protein
VTRVFQRYFEINVISREFYMGVYGKGPENFDVLTRENVILRYVISGFHSSYFKRRKIMVDDIG